MSSLSGKVAIVTGAGVGMGREIAVQLAREGAAVVVNYSRSAKEAEATARLVSDVGARAFVVQADVAKDGEVRHMVDKVVAEFGRIDILVNNAGITVRKPFDDLEAMSDEVWDSLYAVNVKGMFNCSRAVAEPMKKAGDGCIINLASVAGIRPSGSSIAYCASKAAMIHVANCLAKVLAPTIRVNTIAPGFIDETRWNEGIADLDALRTRAAADTPLKRLGKPSDIAEAVVYLAKGGRFMTGGLLVVDGGRQFYQ